MPRWNRAPDDYDAEIAKVEAKIAKYTQLLSELKERSQELQTKKRDATLQKIYEYMTTNGMTPEQILSQLQSAPAESIAAATNNSTPTDI